MARQVYGCVNHILKTEREFLTEDYKSRNKERQHRGMDFVALSQNGGCITDYVIAIEKGVVAIINKNSSIGNYIYIKHENGLYSVYYHLKDGTNKVKVGDNVDKGQILAFMGNTGNSTGAHLHFGILTNTNGTSDIDPRPYLMNEKSLLKEEEQEEPISNDTYKVKKGDTLWGIANNVYGDGNKYTLIANANGITNPNLIRVGQELIIPNVEQKQETYKIKKGDTLSSIAKKYNTTWQKIYEDNKSVIGTNPNLIRVGVELTIK